MLLTVLDLGAEFLDGVHIHLAIKGVNKMNCFFFPLGKGVRNCAAASVREWKRILVLSTELGYISLGKSKLEC